MKQTKNTKYTQTQIISHINISEKDEVSVLADRVRKSFNKVHGEMEVGKAGEVADLFRQIFQLVLRDVQLTELLQLTYRLKAKVCKCNMIMHQSVVYGM